MKSRLFSPKSLCVITIFLLLLFGSKFLDTAKNHTVIEITDPSYLPSEIRDLRLFFSKTVEDGTLITVKHLDQLIDRTYQLDRFVNDIAISPDGKNVVYTSRTNTADIQPIYLWITNLENGDEKKLAGWDVDYSIIFFSNPSYSHDGNQIIFSITWLNTGKYGIGRINSDGSDLRLIDTDLPFSKGPKLSPAGSRFLVTCVGEEKETGRMRFQLCILNENGQYIKAITNSGDAHGSYFFSPQNGIVVYNELSKGGIFQLLNRREDFFYISYPNYNYRQLLLDWIVGVQTFSNDGQDIIFEGRPNVKSPRGIYIINIDGTNLRHLTYFDEFLEDWYADIEDY